MYGPQCYTLRKTKAMVKGVRKKYTMKGYMDHTSNQKWGNGRAFYNTPEIVYESKRKRLE